MHDEHPHPLLAQVPLTVSPFLSLPTSVPLPYSYKTLPSTLPPSILQPQQQAAQDPQNPQQPQQQPHQTPPYIVSASGTSATPDQILTSCVALQKHLQELEDNARRTLSEWQEKRRQEDLAEKRRVAPGWLDNDVHIIKPEVEGSGNGSSTGNGGVAARGMQVRDLMDEDPQAEGKREKEIKEGEDLDRAFGGMKV